LRSASAFITDESQESEHSMLRTLLDKTWDGHVVSDLGGDYQLLHVDRHLIHDLSGPASMRALGRRGLPVRNPELSIATMDHCVASSPGRTHRTTASGARLIPILREECTRSGVQLIDLDSPEQGILHVIGPELGLTLPGLSIVCGDSHSCTHGALGALAWGIGSSEVTQVLATQCIIERKPQTLRVRFDGRLARGVSAKDLVLHLIAREGAELGVGHAVEFAGDAVAAMSIEERMTLCNMSIEFGAKIGQIAPDDVTFEYLSDRQHSPVGSAWDQALGSWRELPSDPGAIFDTEVAIDAGTVAPQITWGTSPAQTIDIDGRIPDLAQDDSTRDADDSALAYMGLEPNQSLEGLPIDHVFIGSCTNSRLSDLRIASEIVRDRRVAEGVEAWVVPGSQPVKQEAEAIGLDRIFRAAGFEWREPGCSRCLASNGETVPPGRRCISTSNRNFVGRQGPGARTHLASPAMAAAAAIHGHITDVRRML
jgi:3-isopropylmalate/(R)-2-methylmalate dehydratase large subunit